MALSDILLPEFDQELAKTRIALERVPRPGDEVVASGWRLRVTALRGRRVESVLARPLPRGEGALPVEAEEAP